jgi:hypothetical protein
MSYIKTLRDEIEKLNRQLIFLDKEIEEYEALEALDTTELEDMLQALVREESRLGFAKTYTTPGFYKKMKIQNVLSSRMFKEHEARASNPDYGYNYEEDPYDDLSGGFGYGRATNPRRYGR